MTSSIPLDDSLLQEYVAGFYGYGNYRAAYWFVGLEEGGSTEDIHRRITTWASRGKRELEDLIKYHFALGSPEYSRWFVAPYPLQSTWKMLIRMVLSAEGRALADESAKRYQSSNLATIDGNTCLMELMPLPAPSIASLPSPDSLRLLGLKDRAAYLEQFAETRAKHLRNLIQEHHPKAVVFYSGNKAYRKYWDTISGSIFSEYGLGKQKYYEAHDANTRYFIVNHPTSFGAQNSYYESIGALLK